MRLLRPCYLALSLLVTLAWMPSSPAATLECATVEAMANDPIIEKEIFHVSGDAPDPTRSGLRGVQAGYELTQHAVGRPKCLYSFGNGGEMIVEIDVYQVAGAPMYLHLLCPHCKVREHGERNALKVSADRKQMTFEPQGVVPTFPGWTDRQMLGAFPAGPGGLLSVSTPFGCSWEVDPRYRMAIGNVCDFKVVIDKNVIRRVDKTR